MRVTAKVDYALRAMVAIGVIAPGGNSPVKAEQISEAEGISRNFLENILGELRSAGLVRSQRGADGGYWLARDPETISVADVIRAVEGPLASVRGVRAESLDYPRSARALQELWIAVRASLRSVLEQVSVADIVSGQLPPPVRELAADPEAWRPH